MNIKTSIEIMGGTAKYVKTEIEDSKGRWNDNYYVKDGYYVLHQGSYHHIYKKESKPTYLPESVINMN